MPTLEAAPFPAFPAEISTPEEAEATQSAPATPNLPAGPPPATISQLCIEEALAGVVTPQAQGEGEKEKGAEMIPAVPTVSITPGADGGVTQEEPMAVAAPKSTISPEDIKKKKMAMKLDVALRPAVAPTRAPSISLPCSPGTTTPTGKASTLGSPSGLLGKHGGFERGKRSGSFSPSRRKKRSGSGKFHEPSPSERAELEASIERSPHSEYKLRDFFGDKPITDKRRSLTKQQEGEMKKPPQQQEEGEEGEKDGEEEAAKEEEEGGEDTGAEPPQAAAATTPAPKASTGACAISKPPPPPPATGTTTTTTSSSKASGGAAGYVAPSVAKKMKEFFHFRTGQRKLSRQGAIEEEDMAPLTGDQAGKMQEEKKMEAQEKQGQRRSITRQSPVDEQDEDLPPMPAQEEMACPEEDSRPEDMRPEDSRPEDMRPEGSRPEDMRGDSGMDDDDDDKKPRSTQV